MRAIARARLVELCDEKQRIEQELLTPGAAEARIFQVVNQSGMFGNTEMPHELCIEITGYARPSARDMSSRFEHIVLEISDLEFFNKKIAKHERFYARICCVSMCGLMTLAGTGGLIFNIVMNPSLGGVITTAACSAFILMCSGLCTYQTIRDHIADKPRIEAIKQCILSFHHSGTV